MEGKVIKGQEKDEKGMKKKENIVWDDNQRKWGNFNGN